METFVCSIEKKGRLYYLTGHRQRLKGSGVKAFISDRRETCELWHKRFGHPGDVNMQRLEREGLVNGLGSKRLGKCETEVCSRCGSCIRGKQTRSWHPSTM